MSVSQKQKDTGIQALAASPCHQLYLASLKCLDKNSYDRSACTHQFEQYKECKAEVVAAKRREREEQRKNSWL